MFRPSLFQNDTEDDIGGTGTNTVSVLQEPIHPPPQSLDSGCWTNVSHPPDYNKLHINVPPQYLSNSIVLSASYPPLNSQNLPTPDASSYTRRRGYDAMLSISQHSEYCVKFSQCTMNIQYWAVAMEVMIGHVQNTAQHYLDVHNEWNRPPHNEYILRVRHRVTQPIPSIRHPTPHPNTVGFISFFDVLPAGT